jgi:PAS domain S-box-containing protein
MEAGRSKQGLGRSELAALLERSPDIVWRYRLVPTPGFEYVSPSVVEFSGYTPAEHYSDPELGRKLVHPDDLPVMEALMAAPEEHPRVMLRWRHKAGPEFTTEHRIVPIRDAAGELVALEGVARPVISRDRTLQIAAGDLVLDLATHRVLVNERVVGLTPSEHRILVLLASSEGAVSASELTVRLWGEDYPAGPRVVQVHVSNLRRKIEDNPAKPRRLVTHRGVGYELVR